MSILSILISRFPNHISATSFSTPPLRVLAPLLSHPRPVVRKRAIVTLSQFIPISQPFLFTDLLKTSVIPSLIPSASLDKQRTTIQLVAAVARHSPAQLASALNDIVPGILHAVEKDDEELREGALQVCKSKRLNSWLHLSNYFVGARSTCFEMSYRNRFLFTSNYRGWQ